MWLDYDPWAISTRGLKHDKWTFVNNMRDMSSTWNLYQLWREGHEVIKNVTFGGSVTCPPVNIQKTMENHHAINGKTHYFDWAIFKFANCQFNRGKIPLISHWITINPIVSLPVTYWVTFGHGSAVQGQRSSLCCSIRLCLLPLVPPALWDGAIGQPSSGKFGWNIV